MKVCLLSKGGEGSDPISTLFGMNYGRITKSGYGKNQWVWKSLNKRHTLISFFYGRPPLYIFKVKIVFKFWWIYTIKEKLENPVFSYKRTFHHKENVNLDLLEALWNTMSRSDIR